MSILFAFALSENRPPVGVILAITGEPAAMLLTDPPESIVAMGLARIDHTAELSIEAS